MAANASLYTGAAAAGGGEPIIAAGERIRGESIIAGERGRGDQIIAEERSRGDQIIAAERSRGDQIIAAVATAPGRAGIGIVRVSGASLAGLFAPLIGTKPIPRKATLCRFLGQDGGILDEGIAIYYCAPHSYTGEDVLELHGHGGDAVLGSLLGRCVELGARLAEPGEFTKRAFLNGKIDLAQAEAVADLIEAASGEAAKSAARSVTGEFSRYVRSINQALIDLRMFVEASLDFPEEDLSLIKTYDVKAKLGAIQSLLESVLASARQGAILRSGIHTVLLGQPNVGKSSLLNALAGDDIAIVTPHPGTTRDSVRERISVEGVPVHMIDTAGLRATRDEVEQHGILRTWRAAASADLALLVVDAAAGFADSERDILAQLPPGLRRIDVFNKIDLIGRQPLVERVDETARVWLSVKTGAGIALLKKELLRAIGWTSAAEVTFVARERHLEALKISLGHVRAASVTDNRFELLAEELRLAHHSLARITGEFSSEELLGEIFSRFCIGK